METGPLWPGNPEIVFLRPGFHLSHSEETPFLVPAPGCAGASAKYLTEKKKKKKKKEKEKKGRGECECGG